jgi:hypothetical protein
VNLSSIVPWGRSLDEYRAMFALSHADLQRVMLDCGGGPASFNAEATIVGAQVVSVDPIYEYSTADIESRVVATFESVISQTRAQADRFVWDLFTDPDALALARLHAMRRFLIDYESGTQARRYVPGSLPSLPFADATFSLGLCSHLLFLYSDHLSFEQHIAAVRELLRVAVEVRIFPLLTLFGKPSPYIAPLLEVMRADGHAVEEVKVEYEFMRGGNTMLRCAALDGCSRRFCYRFEFFGSVKNDGDLVIASDWRASPFISLSYT